MYLKPNSLKRGALALCAVLLSTLACNLQRPNTPPVQPDFPPVTQPNQNPNLPPPPTNDVPAASTQVIVNGPAGVLQILSPLDGATVNLARIEVQGVAVPGAVVTVNDEILIAGPDGKFSVVIILDAGLNLIEIIASDSSGNESVVELTVIYET